MAHFFLLSLLTGTLCVTGLMGNAFRVCHVVYFAIPCRQLVSINSNWGASHNNK